MPAPSLTSSANSGAIPALTGLRGYAALWVLFSHLFFTDSLSTAVAGRLRPGLANGLLRHEYLAVDLFFMLSGFVLTHAHARDLDRGIERGSYVRFLLLRLARVYPLHVVALAGTLAVHFFVPNPLPASNGGCLVLSAAMMSSWGFCTGVSWNAPSWSLSSEWMAYLLLPLVLLCTAGVRRLRTQLMVIGAIAALFTTIFFSYLLFDVFQFTIDYSNGAGAGARVMFGVVLGSVLRRLYDQPSVRKLPWTALFWLSLPFAAASMTDLSGRRVDNNAWAYVAVMFLTFAAACASPRGVFPLASRVPVYLGEISYAVYIFHYPVLLAMRALVGPQLDAIGHRASPIGAQLVLLGATLLVLAVAAIAHHAIEEPFRRRARRWIDERHRVESTSGEAVLSPNAVAQPTKGFSRERAPASVPSS